MRDILSTTDNPQVLKSTGTHNPQVHKSSGPQVHISCYIHERYSVHNPKPTGPQVHGSTGPRVHTSCYMHDRYSVHSPQPTGPQVHRSTGPQVHRSTGPQVHRSTGPQVHRSTGPQVHRSTGPQILRTMGPQVNRSLVYTSCCIHGLYSLHNPQPTNRHFYYIQFRHSVHNPQVGISTYSMKDGGLNIKAVCLWPSVCRLLTARFSKRSL